MKKNFVFKKDFYKKSRGGYSRLLDLSCVTCGTHLFYYQKDGPGLLKRLYLDRIYQLIDKPKQLICSKCKTVLGVYGIYEKENRPMYRLFVGSISKKIIQAK